MVNGMCFGSPDISVKMTPIRKKHGISRHLEQMLDKDVDEGVNIKQFESNDGLNTASRALE